MDVRYVVVGAAICALASVSISADSHSEFEDAFRGAVVHCKSPEQTVVYRIDLVQSKPIGTPASDEEEARVKKLLTESNMPYDRVKHRASYEFVLNMIRATKVPRVQILPHDDSSSFQSTTNCLKDIAQEAHLEIEFVESLSGDTVTVAPADSHSR
jgi:hypothetical protein